MSKIFLPLILLAACFVQVVHSSAEQVTLQIVSVRDYHSMLKAVATRDPLQLYSDEMAADPEACGIIRTETSEGYSYAMIAGMEDQPMKGLSQGQQDYYSRWVEQACSQGEEELTSPLMMYGEHEKGDSEEAKKKLALEQQQAERNRQATDEDGSDSSNSKQRSQNPAAIKETSDHQPPLEIRINITPDDLSEMTGDYPTLDSSYRSPSFSPKGGASSALLHQAEDKLGEARVEVAAACWHFDLSQAQWSAFQALEQASKNHYVFQLQLSVAYNNYQYALATLQQAQVAAYEALNRKDPSYAELNQTLIKAETEVNRTFQEYQAAGGPAQSAFQNYFFAQQRSAQQGLMPGVDYTSVFNEAQLRANRAADQLDKCQEAVSRIKLEKHSVPKRKATGALPKKITTAIAAASASASPKEQAVEKISEKKVGEIEGEGSTSTSSAADSGKTSYKDQGTQISKEDLAAWNREAFLKQQDYWKKTFHQMVMQVQQVKKAVAADFSRQLLHEVSQEESFNVAQTFLLDERRAAAERQAAEKQRAAKKQDAAAVSETKKVIHEIIKKIESEEKAGKERQAAVALEMTDVLHEIIEKAEKSIAEKAEQMALAPTIADALIEEVLSAKWVKTYFKKIVQQTRKELLLEQQQAEEKLHLEKKKKIFSDLFFSEREKTEREKWEQQESAASIRHAKEQQRAEMERFCTERVNLLHPAEEAGAKNGADTVAPLIQRAGDIFTQCYRRPYKWCSDTVQLMQDWSAIQVESGKVTAKFFEDKGLSVIDVPTPEYALKNAQVAQQLYNELVKKRRQEEAAAGGAPRERDPRKELGYFEQLPLMLEGPVFKRFVASFFTRNIHDFNRESDERAADYFRENGKSARRNLAFWKKSTEIEEQLKKERLEKAKWFMKEFPNKKERLYAAKAWGAAWRERLQQEREQKEAMRLEQIRLAEELSLEQARLAEESSLEQARLAEESSLEQARLAEEVSLEQTRLDGLAKEAKRQQIEKELLDQEAKEKAQKKKHKSKMEREKNLRKNKFHVSVQPMASTSCSIERCA